MQICRGVDPIGSWRRAASVVVCLAAACILLLLLAGVASAAVPAQLAPAPGSFFEAESPPTFTASDSPPPGSEVYLRISTSPTVDASGQIGDDVEFAAMGNQWTGGPVTASPTTWQWSPSPWPSSYPWLPGTYYWQVSHIDCAATPTCDVVSPVWSFEMTPVPPPQPVLPADNATVLAGSTVTFTVQSPIAGDLGARIVFANGQQITAYGYGVGANANDSYFRVQLANQTGTLTWTAARADCRLSSACPLVTGATRTLRVVAPFAPPPPKTRPACRRGYTLAKIAGGRVCLHAGEFCSHAHARQYLRYGYQCVRERNRYRLRRRR
jgi:hypothetical protein